MAAVGGSASTAAIGGAGRCTVVVEMTEAGGTRNKLTPRSTTPTEARSPSGRRSWAGYELSSPVRYDTAGGTGQGTAAVPQQCAVPLADDYSTTNTESVANGSSVNVNLLDAAAEQEFRYHAEYTRPQPVTHPLEENFGWVFVRSCAFHLAGLLFGVPVIAVLLLAVLVLAPLRALLWLVLRLVPPCRPTADCLAVGPHSCDMWWPLSTHSEPCPSLSQCIVTLQLPIATDEARREIANNVLSCISHGERSEQPRRRHGISLPTAARTFTQPPPCRPTSTIGGCPPSATPGWSEEQNFTINNHVYEVNSLHRMSLRPPSVSDGAAQPASSCEPSGAAAEATSQASRVASLRDLEIYVNYPTAAWSKRRPPWAVKLLPQFGSVEEGTCCSLVLLEMQARLAHGLCPLRFLTLWTGGHLTFDVEPKFRRSLAIAVSPGLVPPYNVFLAVSYALWTACQAVSASPLALLLGAVRRPHPVWRHVQVKFGGGGQNSVSGGSKKRRAQNPSGIRRYRVSTTTNGSSAGGNLSDLRRQSASVSSSALIGYGLAPGWKRVTWARISNMDQVLRAERILRTSTCELLLAFIAGAIRRHFRSQGIRHPPNVRACVPVSNRDYLPVSRQEPCDFLVVPIELPTGIEGNIPRVWAVQRALADALDDPFALGARMARCIGRVIAPQSLCTALLRNVYGDAAVSVAFMRTAGDATLHGRRIHSVLSYTPVPDEMRCAFGFIQCGTEMVVTLTADSRVYPEPDRLLAAFQSEVLSLLRQLSVRLLTLSQATYLPTYSIPTTVVVQQPQQTQVATQPCDGSPSLPGSSTERPLVTAPASIAHSTPTSSHLSPCYSNEVPQGGRAGVSPGESPVPVFAVDYSAGSELRVHASVHEEPSEESASKFMLDKSVFLTAEPISSTGVGAALSTPSISATLHGATRSTKRTRSASCFVTHALSSEHVRTAGMPRGNRGHRASSAEAASLEELEQLLSSVQDELDTLRAHPQHGDRRVNYLRKLSELEQKMEAFHQSISSRLNSRSSRTLSVPRASHGNGQQPSLADAPVLDELLAPLYDEEQRVAYSHEPRRPSIVTRIIRKRSRQRCESPTRRLSPRVWDCPQALGVDEQPRVSVRRQRGCPL